MINSGPRWWARRGVGQWPERGSVTVLTAGVLLAAGPFLLTALGVGQIELARARAAAAAEAAAAAPGCPQALLVAALDGARLLGCNVRPMGGPGGGGSQVTVAVTLPGWLARRGLGPVVVQDP